MVLLALKEFMRSHPVKSQSPVKTVSLFMLGGGEGTLDPDNPPTPPEKCLFPFKCD